MSAALSMVSAVPASHATFVWRGRRAQMILLVMLVALGMLLRVMNLGGITRRTPDEYTYTDSANTLLQMGTAAGYPVLFANFVKDPVRPSPTRLGYHALLMATMRLTGDRTPQAGAWLACLASVLSLALLAWLGWTFFPPAAALIATLLYAVSPVELMFARRCWEESLVELLCLASAGVACCVTNGSRHRGLPVSFALLGAVAITVKEFSAVGFLFAAVWCVALLVRRREFRLARLCAASGGVALLLALVWSAQRLGGFAQLSQLSIVAGKVAETSPYGLQYNEGPAWLMLLGLWIVSATTAVLAGVGFVALGVSFVARARVANCIPNRTVLLGLTAMGALFVVLTMIFPEKLNLRLIAPAFGPLSLLAGVGFCAVLGCIRGMVPATEAGTLSVLAAIFVVLGAALDYGNFATNFARADMQDLAIRMVIESSGRTMPATPASAPAPAARTGSPAAEQIELSAQFIQRGENEEGIAAAQKALALDPQSAVAWNNIAAANENLKRWDAAIDAARHALQLQPEFQLARNNLAWSLAQKAKESVR